MQNSLLHPIIEFDKCKTMIEIILNIALEIFRIVSTKLLNVALI